MKPVVRDAKRRAMSAVRTLSRRVFGDKPQAVWRGHYRSFAEVPASGPGYDGDEWLSASADTARELLALSPPHDLGAPQRTEHALLSLLVATRFHGACARILDIGGGVGVSYILVKAAVENAALAYQILERDGIAREATRVLGARDDLAYRTSIEAVVGPVDIVYLSAVLQYIDDYRGLLRQIFALQPQLIFLANVNAGAIETYASAQINVRGSVIPCWFFNRDELVAALADAGYALVFHAVDTRNYEQQDVPPEQRLHHPLHLLFERTP